LKEAQIAGWLTRRHQIPVTHLTIRRGSAAGPVNSPAIAGQPGRRSRWQRTL